MRGFAGSLAVALLFAAAATAQPAPPPEAASPPVLKSEVVRRWKAPEATQGVAVDAKHFYAVSNSKIAKYDKASGVKVAEWAGDRARFPTSTRARSSAASWSARARTSPRRR